MRKATIVRTMLGTVCGLALCSAATSALAQDAAPLSGVEEAPQGDDIIVTARKRNESILKVPVVVTAITQADLERFANDDLYTISQNVPGLLIGTSLAANGLQVSMRGIGTTANNSTVDNSISLNIDGVQLSQGLSYGMGMFDVGQVEVLKGPQALFFGKNSPAGVISLRSADPTGQTEISARVGYEFYAKERTIELVASGPVTDSVGLRLAARYSDQDGFFRNVVQVIPNRGSVNPLTRDVTPTQDLIVRGTALFQPSPGFSSRVKLSYERFRQDGTWPALQGAYCPEGINGVPPLNLQFIGDGCVLDRNVAAAWPDPAVWVGLRNNGRPFNDMDQVLGSVENNLEIADHIDLTTVTAYYGLTQKYLFLAGFSTILPLVADSDFLTHQFTQELRLASDFDTPLNFTVGAFYQRADQQTRVRLFGNPVMGLPLRSQRNDHKIDINSFSLFGQLIWRVSPQVELAGGARWTKETRRHQQWNYLASNGPVGQSVLLDPKVSSSNVSPEATITYTPNDDLTIFAAYKTGFKSGSFNGTIYAGPTTPASFGDEKVNGGEVGLKSRLGGGDLTFNAAAYYYHYTGLQVGAGEIRGAVIINRTLNAASANVYGVDLDMTYAPPSITGLRLQAAVNYNRARYGSFPNAPCGNGQTIGQGCDQLLNPTTGRYSAQDLKGETLVRAPEWMATLGFTYDMPVGGGLGLTLAGNGNYSSRYSTNLTNLPGFFQSAYAKVNASIAVHGESGWEISLLGNNLTNKITSGSCSNSNLQNGSFFGGQIQGGPLPGAAGSDEANCVADRGREVWIRAKFKFGS